MMHSFATRWPQTSLPAGRLGQESGAPARKPPLGPLIAAAHTPGKDDRA